LAAIADAAALAGASGLDVEALRDGGVVLDLDRVDALVADAVAAHSGATLVDDVEIAMPGSERVEITVRGSAPLGLLGVLVGESALEIEVHSSAEPRRIP
jgi:hypothetical protein